MAGRRIVTSQRSFMPSADTSSVVQASIRAHGLVAALRRKVMVDTHVDDGLLEPGEAIAFSCDGCVSASTCEFAFDMYNLDGDCLDEK